jgi:hypothetical protein
VSEKFKIAPENAAKMSDWLRTRGGIAIWSSINLSNIGATWSTPALTDGKSTPKPTWQAGNEPDRIITDPGECVVVEPREVNRFYVAIRPGAQGFVFKVTDGGTRRIRGALAKANRDARCAPDAGVAWYEFDYSTQEAVIFVEGETRPLGVKP